MSLRLTEKGCTDFSNNEILRFSKKFKDILNELIQKDYKPVSYTHLDVYKRQRFACSTQACVSCVDVFVIDWTRIELGPPNGCLLYTSYHDIGCFNSRITTQSSHSNADMT